MADPSYSSPACGGGQVGVSNTYANFYFWAAIMLLATAM